VLLRLQRPVAFDLRLSEASNGAGVMLRDVAIGAVPIDDPLERVGERQLRLPTESVGGFRGVEVQQVMFMGMRTGVDLDLDRLAPDL